MDDKEWLAARFEQHRPRLRAVAYRMLGSLADARPGHPAFDLVVAAHLQTRYRERQRAGRIPHLLGRVHQDLRAGGRPQLSDLLGPRVRVGSGSQRHVSPGEVLQSLVADS